MSAFGVPTMTEAEVADWERRLRSGSLWARLAATTSMCACGHREGTHAGFRWGGETRGCEARLCECRQFVEVSE